MPERDDTPDVLVFDAEPLVTYFADEPGSDVVEGYLEAVEGAADGYLSAVTLTEVHYVVRAIDGGDRADGVVDVLTESGLRRVDTAETWRPAARFKYRYSPSLGDAFALGTAAHLDATLIAGRDGDFEAITEVPIVRIGQSP